MAGAVPATGAGRSLESCTGVHCSSAYTSARAERCASCQADLRKEERSLERTIRDLQRDSKNAAKQVAIAAKRGDMASARTLAKETVHTKKVSAGARVYLLPATPLALPTRAHQRAGCVQAVTRIYVNKATLVAMNAQLTEQLGMVKVAGTLQQSTQVTTLVNNLMRAPELQQTVVQMQKEMMKVRCQYPRRFFSHTAAP